jgi:hypothetical protein
MPKLKPPKPEVANTEEEKVNLWTYPTPSNLVRRGISMGFVNIPVRATDET